jgi:hypothetical protein
MARKKSRERRQFTSEQKAATLRRRHMRTDTGISSEHLAPARRSFWRKSTTSSSGQAHSGRSLAVRPRRQCTLTSVHKKRTAFCGPRGPPTMSDWCWYVVDNRTQGCSQLPLSLSGCAVEERASSGEQDVVGAKKVWL